MRPLLPAVLVAACSGRSPAPAVPGNTTAPVAAAPADLPGEPAEAAAILERLDRWCTGHDDCAVAEHPDAFPGRVAHGETTAWIAEHRRELAALGVEVVWELGVNRFVTLVESDLRLMTGGNFAVDHVGPDRHAAVLARARARAALYLGVLVARIGPVGGAPYAIELLRDADPEAARIAEERLR